MVRHAGRVESLFIGLIFPKTSPKQISLSGTFTAYARTRSEQYCERWFNSTGAMLVLTPNQSYLVMRCDDGIRRSFGAGTIIAREYELTIVSVA